jgi:hypothetical protein
VAVEVDGGIGHTHRRATFGLMPARVAAVILPEPLEMSVEAWAELVDGRVAEEEAPSILHEGVVAWLVRLLGA